MNSQYEFSILDTRTTNTMLHKRRKELDIETGQANICLSIPTLETLIESTFP